MAKSKSPETELKKSKEANRKLKGQVLKLRKQIRVLRSELQRYRDVSDFIEDNMFVEELESESVGEQVEREHTCPKCSKEITQMDTGKFIIKTCNGCSWSKSEQVKF